MTWDSALHFVKFVFNHYNWVLQVFFTILGTAALRLIVAKMMARLINRAEKTENRWDDLIFQSLDRPLNYLIWLIGVCFAASIVAARAPEVTIFEAITPLRELGLAAIVAWGLMRFISNVEHEYSRHEKIDQTLTQAISQLLRVAVVVTTVLLCLQSLGLKISGLLAVGGAGTLVLGLAGKELLANFFGGLVIYTDRPFKVGDWIRSPDREIEGTVEYIGWRSTRIRTFDKRPLYVPNAVFTSIAIENPSRMSNRRIKQIINLRYDDAAVIPKVLQDVKAMLQEHPEIDTSQTLMVNIIECAASSINMMIYCFTKTTNWQRYQNILEDVLLKILALVEENGAECAFPTRTLHVPEGIAMSPEPNTLSTEE